MIVFDYECNYCGERKTNEEMDSFRCECGGEMKLLDKIQASVFQPFYSREMKAYITSPRHEEKMLRKKGFSYFTDHKDMVHEAKQIRKHKEEIIRDSYAKIGAKYTPHSNTTFDEKTGEFKKRDVA